MHHSNHDTAKANIKIELVNFVKLLALHVLHVFKEKIKSLLITMPNFFSAGAYTYVPFVWLIMQIIEK